MTRLAAQLAGIAVVLLGSALTAAGPADRTPAAPRAEPNAAPKAAPPITAPPTPEELRIRLGRCVDQRVADLASDDPQRCVQGQTALLGLARVYLDALSQYVDHDDLETRVRARDLLSHVLTETRVCRILLKLPPAQRAKLHELRKQEPGLFQEMLAKDWARRVQAVRELTEPRRDPKHLAEPLLILSLQHPSAKLVSAAATAAGGGDYRSDAMVDALLALLVRHWDRYDEYPPYAYRGGDDGGPANPATAALWALQELNSPRAVPGLLALLCKDSGSDISRQVALAELIGAAGERRAIPALIERLDRVAPRRRWHGADVRGTYTPADFAFLALLRLTGQAPSSYDFTYGHQYDRPFVMFATRARRRAAFAKFRQWWDQQKDNKPYRGLEPLKIPDLATVGRFPQGGQTAASAKAVPDPPSAPAIVDTGALRDALAARVHELARKLGAGRLRERTDAHGDLTRLHDTYLAFLLAHANAATPEVHGQLVDVLGDLVVEARLCSTRAALSPTDRKKFTELDRTHPQLLKNVFSLAVQRRLKAMERIRTMDDPNGLAEPIVLMGLRDPLPEMLVAAGRAAESGKYRSDAIVAALQQILIDTPDNAWNYGWYGRGDPPARRPAMAAVTALQKIQNPKAPAVLLAVLIEGRSGRLDRDILLAGALVATGDKRVIPHLIPMLARSASRMSTRSGSKTVTMVSCDPFLMALIKLTGQDPKDYKFVDWPHGDKYYGFQSDADRKAAIAKFKSWWRKNRSTPTYRKLGPIDVPKLRGPQQRGAPFIDRIR